MQATDNLLDPSIYVQYKGAPHHVFDVWRKEPGLHWNPPNPDYHPQQPFAAETKGFYVLTRYSDVFEVSRDQSRFSSYDEGFLIWDQQPPGLENLRANFMGMQPENHASVKRVITPPFMPKSMQEFEPKVNQVAEELVDDIAGRGSCEFVFDVASKLPVHTFCELVGVPEHLRDAVEGFGNAIADTETRAKFDVDPAEGLAQISKQLTERYRESPDDSLMSAVVNDQSLNLNQQQIDQFFQVFAVAGHETTRSTSAHFVNLMHQNPDQYELLCSDVDAHLENAIEEVLRYTSTTTHFRRTATMDTQVGDVPVKKGDKLLLSYAAANRDPEVFPDAHRFDITRPNARKHLSFGTGPHVCTGARLARMQLKALIRQLVTRLPDLKPAGEPRWLSSIWFNAIIEMPVVFTPETAGAAR